MLQSFAVTPSYRRPGRRYALAKLIQFALRSAFIGVWVVLPLLPLTAILLTWLSNL